MARIKHGDTGTPLFNRWNSMINRCKKGRFSKTYFNNGIGVCKEWQEYKNFKSWALQNGWDKDLELDRRDNNKGYSPDNCRFITKIENNSNRSNTIFINYKGKRQSLTLYCLENNIPTTQYNTIRRRIMNGWDHTKAIETPIRTGNYGHKKQVPASGFPFETIIICESEMYLFS